jgi:hypothetical protein
MNEGTKNYTSGNKNELHTKNSRNKNLVIFSQIRETNIYEWWNKILYI